jgi:hypothetical protein
MLTHRIPVLLLVATIVAATFGCKRVSAPIASADAGTALEIRKALEAGAAESGGGGGGGGATLAEPTGWATLTGRFQMIGTPPRLSPLNIDKDTTVCAPGGVQVLEETVEVSSTGGIKNVWIYLVTKTPADDPKWEHESYLATKDDEVIFDQKACVFLSHVAAMRSNQTLRILNSDNVLHNTNIQAGRGAIPFNGSVPSKGQTAYQPGGQTDRPFPISCSVHPWMSAYMITRDSPYFAITNADGGFEMANVPAGVELEFRVWQEKAGFLQKVSVNGTATPWKQGRFSISLANDEQHEMAVTIDASVFQ